MPYNSRPIQFGSLLKTLWFSHGILPHGANYWHTKEKRINKTFSRPRFIHLELLYVWGREKKKERNINHDLGGLKRICWVAEFYKADFTNHQNKKMYTIKYILYVYRINNNILILLTFKRKKISWNCHTFYKK